METAKAKGIHVIGADDVCEAENQEGPAVFGLEANRDILDSTIERADYAMGEKTQQVAENGPLTHLIFSRNEPALNHAVKVPSPAPDMVHTHHRDDLLARGIDQISPSNQST